MRLSVHNEPLQGKILHICEFVFRCFRVLAAIHIPSRRLAQLHGIPDSFAPLELLHGNSCVSVHSINDWKL